MNSSPATIKLSDYVAQFVSKLGVKHVFMLTGGGSMHLNDSFGNLEHTSFVCTLHEQAAAIAAEAYSRVSGNLGVTVVTAGPGGTNTLTGVVAAWLDSTPCLFISGQVKLADLKKTKALRQNGVQEVDITDIMSSVTKYAVTVKDPATIKYHLEQALHLCLKSGRPGPVWIDIPLDIQAAEICPDDMEGYCPPDKEVALIDRTEAVTKTAIKQLAKAQRPVLLLGNGIRLSAGCELAIQFIQQLGIPVLTTRLGVDLVEYKHASLIGMPGSIASRAANYTLQNCDYLLCIGARMDMALLAYAPQSFAPKAYKVMVNIDEQEIIKLGGTVDLPIVADASMFLQHAINLAKDIVANPAWKKWLARCQEWKLRYPFVQALHSEGDEISVYGFADRLSSLLQAEDIILPGSSGLACEIFLTAFKAKAGQRIFHNKGTGAMGLGQPAAIGACLASGLRRTICVDGDGGFQMNIQELETVKRLGLPIKFFVIDNDGYASIRTSQSGYFGRCTGADSRSGLSLPDVEALSAAYGIATTSLISNHDLELKLQSILNTPGPMVVRVKTKSDEQRVPRVLSIKLPDGTMTSMPLECMWPYLPDDEHLANMTHD